MTRHLETKHKDEASFAQILAMPKGTNSAGIKLINGDFNHNFEVIGGGEGIIIPRYRGTQEKVDECVHCSNCKGLYSKKNAQYSFKCSGVRGKA